MFSWFVSHLEYNLELNLYFSLLGERILRIVVYNFFFLSWVFLNCFLKFRPFRFWNRYYKIFLYLKVCLSSTYYKIWHESLCEKCVLKSLSGVWLFVIPRTVAHQAALSMTISRQESWSGLSFPPPGHLSSSGTEPTSLESPALAGGFFITAHLGSPKCEK